LPEVRSDGRAQAGFDLRVGQIIHSMDGDLQHETDEIQRFFEKKLKKDMTW